MDHFREDGASVSVGGLTIENGVGSMVIHGSQVLRPDDATLDFLRALRGRVDEVIVAIEGGVMLGPEEAAARVGEIENPFV